MLGASKEQLQMLPALATANDNAPQQMQIPGDYGANRINDYRNNIRG
jgi:hypothetical protein